jgi:phenylacetate-CoA ligase
LRPIDLYGAVYRRALLPWWEHVLRGRSTLEHWRTLEASQWRSPAEILAMQAGALERLVAHAYAYVPFYRCRMDAAGVRPAEIRTPLDLQKLPVLTRAEAAEAGRTRASTAPPLVEIEKATSGSTGRPLAFGYDRGSESWRQAIKWRGYGWAGYRPGDRSLHYWGRLIWPPPPLAKRVKMELDHLLRREHYVACTLRGEPELERVVELIRRKRPSVLVCYAQAGADLARFIVERRLRDWDTIPVICGAERLLDADRAALSTAFGPAVFETYGARETMLIAAECEVHQGLHVAAENIICELVVEAGGQTRPARPGEVGQVVLTDLHNFGMPFLRYANGDLAIAGPEERCACGRGLPRLAAVDGRTTETLRNGAGARVSSLIFNVIFAGSLGQSVRQFQAVQHRDGAITLKLVPAGHLDGTAREHIVRNVERYLTGVDVRMEVVDEIPVSETGKRQVVVVERA